VFVLNATPGVDFLLTVSRTLQGGARAGVAAVAGINAGCVVHALAAAFGLAAVLAVHPGAFQIIQWAGAAYLVWLGLGLLRQAWRAGGAVAAADGPTAPMRSAWADFRVGLLTNVLNPKVALFFLAFLPQFVPAASPAKTVSFLLLSLWFVLQAACSRWPWWRWRRNWRAWAAPAPPGVCSAPWVGCSSSAWRCDCYANTTPSRIQCAPAAAIQASSAP
jgi:threonine/homoserine/homoserine lactone efflux protein